MCCDSATKSDIPYKDVPAAKSLRSDELDNAARVVRPPEEQAGQPRLSLIYFARPQADVKLRPVESPLLKRLGLQREGENRDVDGVTAEGELFLCEC